MPYFEAVNTAIAIFERTEHRSYQKHECIRLPQLLKEGRARYDVVHAFGILV